MKHLKDESNNFYNFFRIFINVICLAIIILLCLPLARFVFNAGMAFGWIMCISVIFLVNIKPKIKNMKKSLRCCYNIVSVLIVLLIAWITTMSIQILTVSYDEAPNGTTVVVLGARVYDYGAGESLVNRLDVALEYLIENEDAMCVVTGGKGYNEPVTEASVQREYLLEHGISDERILVEDRSKSTYENFLYTGEILDELGLEKTIVISTQNFHQFRARDMAKRQGYIVYSVGAKTSPIIFISDFSRETMALTKYYIDLALKNYT